MPATAAPATAHTSLPRIPTTAPPAEYVPLPQRLLTDLYDTPLALGLYALVGRLYLVHQTPIALSVPDVLRFDPTLSRGAVLRAFARLVRSGWLIEHAQVGHKTRYTPTWGRVKGLPLPWQMRRPCLGRPRHVARLCLDRHLLDTCMGKLTPHPTRAAPITRYISVPVLSIMDIGCYALTLAGLPHETPSLRRLSAVRDGLALSLPDEAHLLALISQRTLVEDEHNDRSGAVELTASGARKLGLGPLAAPAPLPESAPLFFVPKRLIGMLIGPVIGSMIGATNDDKIPPVASSEDKSPHSLNPSGITWESGNLANEATPPPSPSAIPAGGGGLQELCEQKGCARLRARRHSAGPGTPLVLPDTPGARALHALQVRPEQIIELADLPVDVIQAAIAHGQARDDVRDLAGWVVSLLRAHRDHGWTIPAPALRPDSPEALRVAFQRYAAEQQAARQAEQEIEMLTQPYAVQQQAVQQSKIPASAILHETTSLDLAALWREVLERLQLQTNRQEFDTWLRGTMLHSITGGVAAISAPNVLVKEAIESRYLGMLRDLLSLLTGLPLTVRVVLQGARSPGKVITRTSRAADGDAPPAELPPGIPSCTEVEVSSIQPRTSETDKHEEDACPAWIAPATWATLPALLRAALRCATLETDEIRAASPHLDRLLRTRYAREIAALISASHT